jgi:nicotinate-nucleotide pyrophosphorylase (carboxylating)
MPAPRPLVDRLLQLALDEDLARGDVTSESIFGDDEQLCTAFRPRQPMVVSGLWVIRRLIAISGAELNLEANGSDGDRVEAGAVIATLSGPTVTVLALERSCLNFLSHLSAIATFTRSCVDALGEGRARLVDTRKTTPGWRQLEKMAVRHGGARNHRNDLGDGVMIKDNHIAAAGSLRAAVEAVRSQAHHLLRIEVEVDREEQLEEALSLAVDVIMLDNFDDGRVASAVARVRSLRPQTVIELSGGITLDRLPRLQALGADVISMGALTHSAPSVDIGLDHLA